MKRSQRHGFTLVELSVVLLIVSLVAAMGIGLGSNALKAADRFATQEKLATIKKALNQFAKQNGYLPCPADRTAIPSSANFGVERRLYSGTGYTSAPSVAPASGTATMVATISGGAVSSVTVTNPGSGYGAAPAITISGGGGSGATATSTIANGAIIYVTVPSCDSGTAAATTLSGETYIGALPVRSLGLPDSFASDSWSNKFTYAANANLTVNAGSYSIPEIGGPLVYYGTLASAQIATRLPAAESPGANGRAAFVVVSHGPDGRGSYPVDGTAAVGTCGSTNADAENCDDDNSFIDGRSIDGTQASQFFDDYMVWDTNLSQQGILSNVSGSTTYCSTSPTVCEPWCAQCFTNLPAAPASMGNPQLCRRIITSASPCQATCLWGGTLNSSGKYAPCP